MVGIALYIRLRIPETPVFRRLVAEQQIARTPVLEVIKHQPKQIILAALARMAEQASSYVYAAFLFTYGTIVLHSSRDLLLSAVLTAAALSLIAVPLSGHLSDRVGRKRMYLIGAAATGGVTFVYFEMMNTTIGGWIFLAVVLSFVPWSMMYAPQAALIAECFPPRLRYSGASLGYQLSSVVAGGPAPFIATALLAAFGSGYAIAFYILFCVVISIVATVLLPDYTNRDISSERA